MTYQIFGNFNQSAEIKPSLVKAFGDDYVSLGFAANEFLPARVSKGVYVFMTGDELGTGDNTGKIIRASFGLTSPVKSYRVGVIDTMKIQLETFDVAGNPVDIDGDFSLDLTLFVPEE